MKIIKVPTFLTIRQTAATGIMTEYSLRMLLKQGKLPGRYTGNRFLVDLDRLSENMREEGDNGNE